MGERSATDKFFRITSTWHKYDPKTLFIVWHAVRGGIDDAKTLSKLTGERINGHAIEGIMDTIDRLVFGPVCPHESLRCVECGGSLVEVPCRNCGLRNENYRMLENVE